ncbi:MAG: uracil-DNA glycosylase [Chthonomonadales bacterium]
MDNLAPDNQAQLFTLSSAASGCTACGLSKTRNKVVFGEGKPNAPLVFVGEGPGQNEDASGRPFVGRAGELLDQCLAECRMNRSHVYICNIVKCRACLMEFGRVKNRQPAPEEIDSCSDWLAKQLGIIQPMVIVCLGAPAANTLIHANFKITQERGKWFDTSPHCRYISAALHPAYILRQDGPAYLHARQMLVDDIEAARKKVIAARKEPNPALF